jgi:hypothetical protein
LTRVVDFQRASSPRTTVAVFPRCTGPQSTKHSDVIELTPDLADAILRASQVDYVVEGHGSRVVAITPEPGEETLDRATPAVLSLG